jgi:hypothetical protein
MIAGSGSRQSKPGRRDIEVIKVKIEPEGNLSLDTKLASAVDGDDRIDLRRGSAAE